MKAWRAVAAAFLMMLALAPAASAQSGGGRWYRGESANFIVYGENPEAVSNAAQSLEDFDATLRRLLQVQAPSSDNKLEVYLVRNFQGLRTVVPNTAEGIAGFYSTSDEFVGAFLIYSSNTGMDRRVILFHEYAHHFMLHYAPQAYPQWYVEGWAEFVATMEVRDRRAIVGTPSEGRVYTISEGNFLPIEQFLAPERSERRPRDFMYRFYAQSWFAAQYIANTPARAEGLVRYVDALGRGEDTIAAFEPAFGISTEAFAQELRAYMRGRAQLIAVPLPTERAEVVVTRLGRSADDLLLPLARLRLGRVSTDDKAAFATEIEQIAARYPGDALAGHAMARAALLRDDRAGARARLEPVLTANENDVEARYLMGRSYLDDAYEADGDAAETAVREARRQFVRAFRADPDHFPTLFRYALTYSGGGRSMAEEHLNVLARAAELAPQVDTIRMTYALELMEAGEFENAIGTLRPLMYQPHSERYSRYVRSVVDAARRQQRAPDWSESEATAEEGDAEGGN